MKSSLRIKLFLNSNKREIRFVLFFLLFFLLGQVIHFSVRSYTAPFLVHKLNTEVSSGIINCFTPDEKTFVQGMIIGSGSFRLRIAEGCEGIEGIILVVAAVCAFPMGLRQKLFGMLAGSLIIYFSNLVRIVALYYTLKHKPEMFDVMHVFVGQTFIVFVGLLFFVIWINTFGKIREKPS